MRCRWWHPFAAAQTNLGELLDAGAAKLSPDEFKAEVVQRVIVGPTPSGGSIEVMYVPNGLIQGLGSNQAFDALKIAPISGDWTVDDGGRICTRMRIFAGGGGWGVGMGGVTLLARCQYWYRHGAEFSFPTPTPTAVHGFSAAR